ncbi:MAG: zinc ribbon domain-containing protein [Clostridia bacterium]|nr:zinc ribbon domain-containing protein [Clostridia bacterium]
MTCEKCGTVVEEGALFCCMCGERLDGKKNCVKCNELIPANAKFCSFCGSSQEPIKEEVATATVTKEQAPAEKVASDSIASAISYNVQNGQAPLLNQGLVSVLSKWANPVLILGGLLVLFICSFFIGAHAKASVSGISANTGINTFYFFGEYYSMATDYAGYAKIAPIICTVVLSLNLLVSFLTFVLGVAKIVVAALNKKTADLTVLFPISFGTFILASFAVLSYISMSVSSSIVSASTNASAGIIAGLVVALTLFCLAIVIKVKNVKIEDITLKGLLKVIIRLTGVIMVFVLLFMLGKLFVSIKTEDAKIIYSIGTLAEYVQEVVAEVKQSGGECPSLVGSTALTVSFGYATIISAVLFVACSIISLFRKNCTILTVGVGLFTLISSIGYLAGGIWLVNELLAVGDIVFTSYTKVIAIGPILAVVAGVIAFGSSLAYFILDKTKAKTAIN